MHHHIPLLKNNGNPRHIPIITNSNKKHSRPSCVAESDSPIDPFGLKLLYDFCMDSNNVYNLQFWVMVLIGMYIFLRGDEIMRLGFFSMIEEKTICNNDGTIAGLFVHVLGKTEKTKKFTSLDYDVKGHTHSSVIIFC